MDEPLGSRLIQSLGDFAQRDGCCRGIAAGRFQRSPKLLNQSLQCGSLRTILQAAFLSLAVRLGGIAIVGHV